MVGLKRYVLLGIISIIALLTSGCLCLDDEQESNDPQTGISAYCSMSIVSEHVSLSVGAGYLGGISVMESLSDITILTIPVIHMSEEVTS